MESQTLQSRQLFYAITNTSVCNFMMKYKLP